MKRQKAVGSTFSFHKGKVIYSTSGNTIIDGLVNYKLQSVASENIKVETEIVVPEQLNIDIADLVTLLGNLLDNALEALKKLIGNNEY